MSFVNLGIDVFRHSAIPMNPYNRISILFLLLYFNLCQSWFCWNCCVDESMAKHLSEDLSHNLFGQHIVLEHLLSAVESHISFQPRKALVLSFHGPSGVGKTFVAKKIGQHLFNGDKSYVKFYSGRNDFVESRNLAEHKKTLAEEVEATVRACPNAVFIFDEADQMADGLFSVLRPYTDYYDSYHGIDFRKTIFIFLSNIGSSEIAKLYYSKKVERDHLSLQDFEGDLSVWLYNKPGGLKEVTLIKNFLVDFYFPFLPLEEEHIKDCIRVAFLENNHQPTTTAVQFIYDLLPRKKFGDMLEYVPSNCKKIPTEVGKYIAFKMRSARMIDEM